MKILILCLTIIGAAVMASEHGNTKTLNERFSDTVISAKPLLGDARVLLTNSLRALEPMKKELKEYSSRILRYAKELFASDPKTRSAAFGNARALAKTGVGLLKRAARALSPLKKDATELATRAGISNKDVFVYFWSWVPSIFGWSDVSDWGTVDTNTEDPGATTMPAAGGDPGAPAAGGDPGATTAPAAGGDPGATTAPAAGGDPGATTAPAAGGDPGATTAPDAGGDPGATTAPAAGGAVRDGRKAKANRRHS